MDKTGSKGRSGAHQDRVRKGESVPNMLVGVYDQTRVDKPMAAKSASTHRILAMPGVLHASWRRGGGCKSVIPTMIKAMCKNHDVVLVLSV